MRWGILFATAMMTSGLAAPAAANEYAVTRARTLAAQLIDDGQCEAALPSARTFWPSSEFATLSLELRQGFLAAVVECAAGLNDFPQAFAAAWAARDLGAPWGDYLLLLLALDGRDNALALQSFDAVSANTPHYLDRLEIRTVWSVLRAVREADPSGAAELRVHEALLARNYSPEPGMSDDGLRRDHARLLLERGQTSRARERIAPVTDPQTLLVVRIDKRFDALRADPDFEQRFDLRSALERHIARARERAAAHPRLLALQHDIVQSVRMLGRPEQALAELDRVLARAHSADGASQFDDYADQINWLLNERGYILYDLGRREEARTAFGQAIGVGEGGHWNVSQVINFASMLQAEGRAGEALEVLRTMGRASPYGDMWAAAVRACAAEQLNDTALRDEAMTFLREHESDNPAALTRGLLCVNDLDGAAAAYVRRLRNPAEREGALLALQIYEPPRVVLSEQEAEINGRKAAVRDRPDVRAAAEEVGRIERVPLHSVYWGET